MGNKYDMTEYVVGVYKEVGKPTHALIKADNHYTYIGPLKSVCGAVSNIHYDNLWAKPIETGISSISNVTCKRCLQLLKQKSLPRIEKTRKENPVNLLGTCTYAMNHPVHALIGRAPSIANPVSSGPLLKALCGSLAFSNVYSPTEDSNDVESIISRVTCKGCLKIIEQRGVVMPKEDKTIELLGLYSYNSNFPTHALVKRRPQVTDHEAGGVPSLRSVCNAYPDVYHSDVSPTGNKAILSKVTCPMCLSILKVSPQPTEKKFFLVFYDGGEVSNVYDFEELLQDAHRFKPTINKILLIELYREVSVKEITVVTDKDGNKITEEDL